jgi:hypothetical protein
MTLSLTCNRCKEKITGEDEDQLVARVQAHVDGHSRTSGHSHAVSREHVLARLERQARKKDRETE